VLRILLVAILTCYSLTVFAQTVYPPEIDEIKKRGKLIVAMTAFVCEKEKLET